MNDFSSQELPAAIGKWTMCEYLAFHNSGIIGDLPVELFTLTSLEVLDLSGNYKKDENGQGIDGTGITGGIPAEIGSLVSLKKLLLSENRLNGEFLFSLRK